jgi:hypothetical protein
VDLRLISSGLLYIAVAIIAIVIVVSLELVMFNSKRRNLPHNVNLQPPPPPPFQQSEPTVSVNSTQLNANGFKPPLSQQGSIFISHAENDAMVALEIANGLENAGYKTWYFERDSLPGVSYLIQTCSAIESSQAVVVIISQASMKSKQMTVEIVRAHEAGKPFIPVLRGVNQKELKIQQSEWAEALGATSSVLIPIDGTLSVMPKIIGGLKQLGVNLSNNSS